MVSFYFEHCAFKTSFCGTSFCVVHLLDFMLVLSRVAFKTAPRPPKIVLTLSTLVTLVRFSGIEGYSTRYNCCGTNYFKTQWLKLSNFV